LPLLVFSGVLFGGREIPVGPQDRVVPEEVIVRLRAGATPTPVAQAAGSGVAVAASNKLNVHVLRLNPGFPQARIDALANRSDVVFVERNRVRKTQLSAPNDPSYAVQWALSAVRALDAWNLVPATSAISGTRVKIAVLDTGTDCTHTDFKGAGGSVNAL
jgi:subtilisin family serine protease